MHATPRILRPRKPPTSPPMDTISLAQLYNYPTVESSKEWVSVLELGGGWSIADIQNFCKRESLPVPPIRDIGVMGATNKYVGDPNSADGEVALDMQNIIAATGGKVGLMMYWAPNTGAGFAAGVAQVALDNLACALSISWGSPEDQNSDADIQAMENALAKCIANGISPFSASGDDGSKDGEAQNVTDYPSSSPNQCGCGGTTKTRSSEVAWSSGGGGYSKKFSRPVWQKVSGSNRMVPDVAGVADPNTGYPITIGGKWYVFGGTSGVSPMWAALTALIVTITGKRLGNMAQVLYGLPSNVCTDILQGSNGGYFAGPGPDACTGLGVPNGKALLAALQGTPTKAGLEITLPEDTPKGTYSLTKGS